MGIRYKCSIFVFLVVLISVNINATNYASFCFSDKLTNQQISNVKVLGVICSESQCSAPVGNLWNGAIKNSNEDLPNNCVILDFPSTLQSHSYTLVFAPETHKSLFLSDLKLTDANNPGTTFANPKSYPFNPIKFEQQASCSSPVSLSVVNNIRENLPVSVTSGANLDSTTSSAIGSTNKAWFPQTMRQYFEVETTLRLRIYKYDSTTSKNIGTPIHTENVVKRIYYDDTVSVAFADWMPPEQVDQFSYYNVTVVSDVTDPKCSSKVNQRASKILRVWRDDPRNACYSLIDSNGLGISPVDFTDRKPEAGEEVTISFRKLSNYANDYEPWNPLFTLTPVDTNINIKLKQTGMETEEIIQTLPRNDDDNFKDVTVKWTPEKSGMYTLEISADANNCPVMDDYSSDLYTQTITVFDPPSYNLKFTVKASGNPVLGANVMIVNPPDQKFTSSLGTVTYNLFKGTYDYRIEKSPYTAV
jgi:hypothetical protein